MSMCDESYIAECQREIDLKMPRCRCSSCDPQGAARLIRLLPKTSLKGLDDLLTSYPTDIEDTRIFQLPKPSRKSNIVGNIIQVCKNNDPIRMQPVKIELAVSLVGHSERLFEKTYPKGCELDPSDLFTREDAWSIVKNVALILNDQVFLSILGGEFLPGHFQMIKQCIVDWNQSGIYLQYLQGLADEEVNRDQEILNQELLLAERIERTRLQAEQKELRSKRILEAKIIRQSKAEERTRKRKAKEPLQRES